MDISACQNKVLGEECEAKCTLFGDDAAKGVSQKVECVAVSFDQGLSTLVDGDDEQARMRSYLDFDGAARTPPVEYPRFRPKGGSSFLLDCLGKEEDNNNCSGPNGGNTCTTVKDGIPNTILIGGSGTEPEPEPELTELVELK
jgi:hypothetical protein